VRRQRAKQWTIIVSPISGAKGIVSSFAALLKTTKLRESVPAAMLFAHFPRSG
jgi:hypothetical protein